MKTLALICSFLALVLSCAPVEKGIAGPDVREKEVLPSPAPDPNIELRESSENQQSAQSEQPSQATPEKTPNNDEDTATSRINLPEGFVLNSPDETTRIITELAESGDPEAQHILGFMYDQGDGVPKDYKEAVKWYTKAAKQGHAGAQCNLGMMYHSGQGVLQNYNNAAKWYAKAAARGIPEAQHNLGLLYYEGKGVRQNYKEAFKWYSKAAEQGDPLAQCKLGLMYSDGKGILEDYVEAYKWLILAASSGDENAPAIKQGLRLDLTPSQIEESQRRAREFLTRQEESPKEDKRNTENENEQAVVSQGTGFLFSETGLVATNYHVVTEKQDIRVYFPQASREFSTTVELKDTANDLAVLRLKDFTYQDIFSHEIPFGVKRSSSVQLGEQVFTLGFPLGDLLGNSAKFSDGTISSLSGLMGSANLFQINNPVQPGNSGGPLFDRDGNLIGIVVAMLDAKFFFENLDTIPQNVNFAIKSDYLINLISMLPKRSSILSHMGILQDKTREEQINSLMPYIVTVYVR